MRTTLGGEIISVVSYTRPWARVDAELSDGTGTIVLRFMGRDAVPGLVTGARLVVEGTPAREGDRLIMRNPLYEFGTTAPRVRESGTTYGLPTMTVVLLDPDEDSRRTEAAALRYGGCEVATVRTTEQAVKHLRAHRGHAVVVDPAPLDAPQLVGELRARTEVPIMVASDVRREPDVVAVLDARADDFVAKPSAIETDDFTIDVTARRAFRADGSDIPLTGVEFRMIEVLLRNPGHLVSREQLLREVWGPEAAKHPNYLHVFTNRIRQKLEPDPAHPRYLRPATGLGLVFDVAGQRSGGVP